MDPENVPSLVCFCAVAYSEYVEKVEITPVSQREITHNVVNSINNPGRTGQLLPQTLYLLSGRLSDEEEEISRHAAKTVHQYAREMDSCHEIINSQTLMAALVQVISNGTDRDTVFEVLCTLHHVSHHSNGALALIRSDALPPLVRQWASPDVAVMAEALVTVHNIISRDQAEAFCATGGIKQLLELLHNVEYPQLLSVVMACLYMVADDIPETQASIVAMNGVPHFLHILRTYDEEAPLEMAMGMLLLLSQNSDHRQAIVLAGGLLALTNFLETSGVWPHILRLCKCTIDRLSYVTEIASAMTYDAAC